MVVDTVDTTDAYRIQVLGVELCAEVECGIGSHEVIVDEIRISCDFDTLNGLLCEDAQREAEAEVVRRLELQYPRRQVTVAKHVDEVLG